MRMYNIMGFTSYINIPVFVVSLAIGLFFVYVYNPDKRKIYIYPTPDNVDTIQYKDSTNTCFEFKQTKTKCPQSEKDISKVPAQA
jgi:hypothetical protein